MKMLFQRFDKCDSTLKDSRLLVMCSLCYTGFLRYDELSNIRSNNLTFHKEHVDIFIIKSKTDCYSVAKADITISLALVYDSFSSNIYTECC
jgi:hypothetical protein